MDWNTLWDEGWWDAFEGRPRSRHDAAYYAGYADGRRERDYKSATARGEDPEEHEMEVEL